jgi:hypothetical protein
VSNESKTKKEKKFRSASRKASHLLIPEVVLFKRFPQCFKGFGIKSCSIGFVIVGFSEEFEPELYVPCSPETVSCHSHL